MGSKQRKTAHRSLGEVLLDVRRAYRLVYEYQVRVRDMMKVIGRDLRDLHFEFREWESLAGNGVPRGSKEWYDTGRWVWDFLPGYFLKFSFAKSGKSGDTTLVEVLMNADQAMELAWEEDGSREPDSRTLRRPESTASVVEIGSWRFSKGVKPVSDWECLGEGNWKEEETDVGRTKGRTRFSYFEVDMADLPNETAVRERICGRLRRLLESRQPS